MIYRHRHLKKYFQEQDKVWQVTEKEPLLFIIEQNSYLYYTITMSLKYLAVPHLISTLQRKDLQNGKMTMGYQVPLLIFEDKVLEANQMIQFICDIFFQDDCLIDFESRKANIKEIFSVWKDIFYYQKQYPYDYEKLSHLGVKDKSSYENLIFRELQNLSIKFHNKSLSKMFPNCSYQRLNLENILFVDIIRCIKRDIPSSIADYHLYSSYEKLITLEELLSRNIEGSDTKGRTKYQVVVLEGGERKKEKEHENWRFNRRGVIAILCIAAGFSLFSKA